MNMTMSPVFQKTDTLSPILSMLCNKGTVCWKKLNPVRTFCLLIILEEAVLPIPHVDHGKGDPKNIIVILPKRDEKDNV